MVVHVNDTWRFWLLTQFANDDSKALGDLLDWVADHA